MTADLKGKRALFQYIGLSRGGQMFQMSEHPLPGAPAEKRHPGLIQKAGTQWRKGFHYHIFN
jgi:hypothetical protein